MKTNWCVLVLILTGCAANAASFDCKKASSPQEKAICLSPSLGAADDRMATAYRRLLTKVPREDAVEVREAQRQWLLSIPIACAARESALPHLLEICLGDLYGKRTDVLQNSTVLKGGVRFFWRSVTLNAPDDPDIVENDRQRGILYEQGTLNASWPRATNKNLRWQEWNTAMESAARGMTLVTGDQPSETWNKQWAANSDMDITVSLNVVNRRLVAATLKNQYYGHGAAHGNTHTARLNWMLENQRELQTEDLFQPGSGWERFLKRRCLDTLKTQFLPDDPQASWDTADVEGLLDSIVINPKKWKLTSDALTIEFDPGTVSCMACGAGPVTILWTDLKPFLKQDLARSESR